MQKEKNPHLFLSLQCWKVSSSACTLQRSSYLPSSVLSAHTRKSEQSKQSSDLHHKLLHVLCCCLALKLKFPAHGHSSCCTFRILPLEWVTFSVKYTSGTKLLGNFKMLLDCDTAQSVQIQILSYFPHHISRGFRGAQAPSPPSAPLLPAWSSCCTPGWQIPSAFPFLHAHQSRFTKSLHMQLLCENRQYPACSG